MDEKDLAGFLGEMGVKYEYSYYSNNNLSTPFFTVYAYYFCNLAHSSSVVLVVPDTPHLKPEASSNVPAGGSIRATMCKSRSKTCQATSSKHSPILLLY